jgi:TolA-binding protein
MDSAGKERYRIEGYLPKMEFRAELESALARLLFDAKEWSAAEKQYGKVVEQYPTSAVAPAAQYWMGVSAYQRTRDHDVLGQTAKALADKFPRSIWSVKASIWFH